MTKPNGLTTLQQTRVLWAHRGTATLPVPSHACSSLLLAPEVAITSHTTHPSAHQEANWVRPSPSCSQPAIADPTQPSHAGVNTTPHCATPHCTTPHCTTPHHTALHHTTLYYIAPHHTNCKLRNHFQLQLKGYHFWHSETG